MRDAGRTLLLRLAGGGTCRLEDREVDVLGDLVAEGLVRRVESGRQMDLEVRYEALQETHRRFQAAKACLERLERRMAPRSRLGGLRASARTPAPGPGDPDLETLATLLQELDIRLPGAPSVEVLPARLDRIRDRLIVDNRSCLDRLALLDREIGFIQKAPAPGTVVEGEGCYALTEAGERTLPEAKVLDALEAALHAVAGSKRHRIDDYSIFKDDPATLLAFLMEAQAGGSLPSRVVAAYEALADAFERLTPYNDIASTRVRNAFLVRLIRARPGQGQAPFLWCNRERLQTLLVRMEDVAPGSVAASPWLILYAADLFIAGPGEVLAPEEAERRLMLYGVVQQGLGRVGHGVDLGDGQFLRLALAILHELLPRNIANPLVLDRTVVRMAETALEGMRLAPPDLGGTGARVLFGFHLAHHARFIRADLEAAHAAYARVEAAFMGPQGRTAPLQVVLHACMALARAAAAGATLPPEEYAGTYARIRRRLQQHKELARAFATERAVGDDEPFLAANLAAQTYAPGGAAAALQADVGLAGVYEPPDHRTAPLLGLAFGTLMLS